MNTLGEIADVLKNIGSAVIFTHMRPDGDTLGCALALSRALTFRRIKCAVVNEGEIPQRFAFLPEAARIRRSPPFDAEAFICVDCSDEARLGDLQRTYARGAAKKITVNIDHHISNTRFAAYNFVCERASNCENVADLIRAMGIVPDERIATFLLMGMVTDSGGFSHADVDGATFRAAAACADAGADIAKISYETLRKQSKTRAELYAEVISGIRYLLGDALAVAVVPDGALAARGLGQDATEGIVDFALSVEPVEVSICLMEVKKNQYKASLRSKGKANVNEVARSFGGGGHILASGCMLFGELEEVLDRLSYTVSLQL